MQLHGGDYNMNLHIFDTSNYLYAGSAGRCPLISRGIRESAGEYMDNVAPIGGVKFLLSEISKFISDDNVLMPVFDRTPEIKRQMYYEAFGDMYGYKGNRKSSELSEYVKVQKPYAERILIDMGFSVQAIEGYEADDIIYSLVKMYKDDFEHIYIHTRDSDLDFLVDTNVSIAQVGTHGKVINRYNYETVVDKDNHTLFCTHHLRKLCKGDVSDNIPGIGKEWAVKMDEVIKDNDYAKLGDLDLCREYLKQTVLNNPTLPRAHMVLKIFNILCPLLVNFDELNNDEQNIDMDKLRYYLHNWNSKEDRWNLEDMLSEFIDSFYE